MREICLDTETTGLDPRSGHKIVEVACVEMVNRVRTGNFFHYYINPRRDVPIEAFNIHGLSTEFLQDKPIFDHIAPKFLEFIAGAKLIIHNAAFDTKFLNHELQIIGAEPINNEMVIDSLAMARIKFPGSPNSLDALCKRFNIDLSKRTKHGALLDAELLADVYLELTGGAQVAMFADNSSIKKSNIINFSSTKNTTKEEQNNQIIRRNIAKRNFSPNAEELAMHEEFMKKNFKKNLWGY